MLIADFTNARPDYLDLCIQGTARWQKDHGAERLVLFFTPDQKPPITASVGSAEFREIPAALSDVVLRDIILAEYAKPFGLGSSNPHEILNIVSFRREVVRAQLVVATTEKIRCFYWGGFLSDTPFKTDVRSDRNFARVVTDEMVSCMVDAIRNREEPVLQSNLRSLLADQRPDLFSRSKSEGISISSLIARGTMKGVIKVERNTRGSDVVTLQGPVAPLQVPVIAPAGITVPKIDVKVRRDRPQEFFDVLETIDFGPYSAIRPKLYDIVSELATERKFTPLVLLRKVVFVLHKRDDLKGTYLENVALFLCKLFTRRPVLVGENGEILSPGLLTDIDSKVCGFSSESEWRDDLDAAILEALIEKDGRVRNTEFSELSMALFNDRAEEGQGRIVRLIAKLNKAKRIVMSPEGYFRILAHK